MYDGPHADLTWTIIGCAKRVYLELRFGFLVKVYENALAIKLEAAGLTVERQAPIKVHYRGQLVGQYVADLLVNGVVIIEVKAVEHLLAVHEVQLVNYLRATPVEVGLVINFGLKFDLSRKILTNDRRLGRLPQGVDS